jgi:sugar phosphate isomerase/epimerase
MSAGRWLTMDDLVLCAGTVRPASFREKVEAASANGFQGLSLYLSDYEQARREGWSDAAIRGLLADEGVAVAELDGPMNWLGGPDPPGAGRRVEEFISAASALDARSVTALELAGRRVGRDIPFDVAAEAFADLCDRAAGAGLLVHIEYFPWSGIPDIGTAYEVTRRAGRSNGGVMVDVWHHVRGPDAGSLQLGVPGTAVLAVQVGDVLAAPGPSIRHEAMHQRLLPGDGTGSVPAILVALRQQGCTAPMEVEVYSDRLNRLPAVEAARLAGDALRGVLARAGLR